MDLALTYHDAQLYGTDIELFQPGNWLNDQCILFVCEYVAALCFFMCVCVCSAVPGCCAGPAGS
jgi:hypothetical protein